MSAARQTAIAALAALLAKVPAPEVAGALAEILEHARAHEWTAPSSRASTTYAIESLRLASSHLAVVEELDVPREAGVPRPLEGASSELAEMVKVQA